MSYLVEQSPDSQIVEIRVGGTLSREVYQELVHRACLTVKRFGRARLLLITLGFEGWDAGLQWGDIHADLEPLVRIDRVAIVGELKWDQGKSRFCRPFQTADIRYFDHSNLALGRGWIDEDSPTN